MKRDPSGYWKSIGIKGGPGSGSWDGPGQPRGSQDAGGGANKYDANFIREVASNILGSGKKITDEDCQRAHKVASRFNDPQDYYDALKEFFNN